MATYVVETAKAPHIRHKGSGQATTTATSAASNSNVFFPLRRGASLYESPVRILAALSWLFWSSRLFVEIGTFPSAAIWSILYGLGSVSLLTFYVLLRSARAIAVLDRILLYGTLFIGVLWVVALVYGNPNYGTDEAAFVQGAAQTLLHGHNPYGSNLSWALQHFAVAPNSYTYTTSGHLITHLNYPALSFLPEALLIAVGASTQATIWVCAFSLALSGLVMFAFVPAQYRPFAAVLLGFDAYFDAAASGLIFTQMMLFLVVAIISWTDFVGRSTGWKRWVSPIALGLSISIQQDSWFLVPCFVVAVYQEAKMRGYAPWGSVCRYTSILVGTFLSINLAFIVMGPGAFVHGILEPLTLSLMPLGQGLIGLTTYLGIGGGDLSLYTLTSLLVLGTLLLALGFHYRRTRFLVPLAPAIVLWFSTRSLEQYVLIGAYSLLAAMCCWRPSHSISANSKLKRARHRKVRRVPLGKLGSAGVNSVTATVLIGLGIIASSAALVSALTSTAPLSVQVVSFHTTGQEQTIDSLYVKVRNNTAEVKNPVYVVENGPYVGTPWLSAGAEAAIPPHSERLVKILAPNTSVMPSLNNSVKVAAFTSGPAAVSTSTSFLPNADHTLLTPFGFSRVIPVGRTVAVQVQVLDRLGSPVRVPGIKVHLGQAVYSPYGLFATENSINGHADGQSPVTTKTDSQGVATFYIRADQSQSTATTLQAWLGGSSASGYSNRVIAWLGYSSTGAGDVQNPLGFGQ